MERLKNLTQGPGDGKITWVITFDYGICNDCEKATQEQVDLLIEKGFTESFHLHDDDGEIYYAGWARPEADFAPLDDFGMPNAGCTEIRYLNHETDRYDTL